MRRSACAYLNNKKYNKKYTEDLLQYIAPGKEGKKIKKMHRDWLSAGADCAPVLVESIPAFSDKIVPTIPVLRQPLLLYSENVTQPSTLPASLSGAFLQTLPDLVTPLKGHSLYPRSCPATLSAPSKKFGY